MGVLTCSRGDCLNAMCDRFSYKYGYICDECFEELVRFATKGGDIQDFMDSPKSSEPFFSEDEIRERLEEEFPIDFR